MTTFMTVVLISIVSFFAPSAMSLEIPSKIDLKCSYGEAEILISKKDGIYRTYGLDNSWEPMVPGGISQTRWTKKELNNGVLTFKHSEWDFLVATPIFPELFHHLWVKIVVNLKLRTVSASHGYFGETPIRHSCTY